MKHNEHCGILVPYSLRIFGLAHSGYRAKSSQRRENEKPVSRRMRIDSMMSWLSVVKAVARRSVAWPAGLRVEPPAVGKVGWLRRSRVGTMF
jgi:hypothetical protein